LNPSNLLNKRHGGGQIAVLAAALGLYVLSAGAAGAEDLVPGLQEENLVPMIEQRLEAVQVEGAQLPALLGKEIRDIRVFAFRGTSFVPIPFQIDERDRKGNLVLPEGANRTSDPDPLFDENDLILFEPRDLGPMVYAPVTGKGEPFDASLKVVDPLDRSAGWVYVLCSPNPPPPDPWSYVRYTVQEGKTDNVDTPYYSIRYPWGAFYSNVLYLYPSSGAKGLDLIDRLKARGTFTLFFSLIKIKVTEDQMHARLAAYRAGPIRVVRRVEYWADFGLGVRSPQFVADITYYDTLVDAPITTKIPARLDLFCSQAFGEIGTDYNRNAYGMMFRNSNNPDGTLIDGRMSPQELHLDLTRDEWRVTTGQQGTFFRGRIPENEMTAQVKVSLVYVDDIRGSDPPEGDPGQMGHVYDRADVLKVKPGVYKNDARFMVPPDYRPGDEKTYLEWEKNPLQVEVEDLSSSE
jgi:hypothetical protein